MEKWWNVTFCLELCILAKRREDEMDGNKVDKFYHSGVYFSCAVPFLALESLVMYLGWHLGFKIDPLSFQQSEGDMRKKIFLQHSFKRFNILFSCHNFPFDSIHKLLFAKTKKIPLESAHCHGGRFLPWYDKWREMHCEQRNVFVILSRRMKDIDIEGEML